MVEPGIPPKPVEPEPCFYYKISEKVRVKLHRPFYPILKHLASKHPRRSLPLIHPCSNLHQKFLQVAPKQDPMDLPFLTGEQQGLEVSNAAAGHFAKFHHRFITAVGAPRRLPEHGRTGGRGGQCSSKLIGIWGFP